MCVSVSECYLALQKEEHEHADEISVGTAPPSALSQRLFCLWVMTTEQPDRERGRWKRGGREIRREIREKRNRQEERAKKSKDSERSK